MKINAFKYSILFLFTAISASCNEELDWFEDSGNTVKNPYVELTDTQGQPAEAATASHQGEYLTFRVNSNTAWTATVDKEARLWCTVNPPSNRGDSRLMVRVMPYTTSIHPRQATVTVSLENNLAETLVVTQRGLPILSMNTTVMSKIRSSQELTINTDENEKWIAEVTEGSEWLSLSEYEGTGISTILITGETNLTENEKHATVVVKTGYDELTGEYTITDTLKVSQRGEMDEFAVTLRDDSDTLSLGWKRVLGALEYTVKAIDSQTRETVGEITLSEKDSVFLFLPTFDDPIRKYLGKIDVTVGYTTALEEIHGESEVFTLHPAFDSASGNGASAETPFLISKRRHLNNIRHLSPSTYYHYRQTADIDFSDLAVSENGNFIPIPTFYGSYDGDNRTISGLNIVTATDNADPTGLFSQTAEGSESTAVVLKNIRISTPYIERKSTTAGGCGAIVGLLNRYGTVSGCTVSGGSAQSASTFLAAIAGDVKDCTLISHCANENCTINGSGANTAGIAGRVNPGTGVVVEYCHNTAAVNCKNWGGGICATLQTGMTIRYCYNVGAVSGTKEIGGIFGRGLSSATVASYVTGCWNGGSVTASDISAGGIGGIQDGLEIYIENCYNSGSISASRGQAGGIIAYKPNKKNSKPNAIKNCYNVGTITNGSAILGATAETSPVNQIMTGCFYLDTSAESGAHLATMGLEAKDDTAMRDFSTFSLWSSEEWQAGDADYPYPQLKNNLHKQPETPSE